MRYRVFPSCRVLLFWRSRVFVCTEAAQGCALLAGVGGLRWLCVGCVGVVAGRMDQGRVLSGDLEGSHYALCAQKRACAAFSSPIRCCLASPPLPCPIVPCMRCRALSRPPPAPTNENAVPRRIWPVLSGGCCHQMHGHHVHTEWCPTRERCANGCTTHCCHTQAGQLLRQSAAPVLESLPGERRRGCVAVPYGCTAVRYCCRGCRGCHVQQACGILLQQQLAHEVLGRSFPACNGSQ